MFTSLVLYSLSLIAAMFVINYGIECFSYLVIAYIHHSAHILFVYKLVLVLLKLGSKHSLVFYTLIELSIDIKVGVFAVISLPKCNPRPLLRWIDLNLLCSSIF